MRIHLVSRIALLVAAALMLSLLPAGATGAQNTNTPSIERLAGPDRYATSLEVARRFVREAGGTVDTVVIVSGTSWHDAVIASALAGSQDAPVVLTPTQGLTAEAEAFLAETRVTQALVVGNEAAVSRRALSRLRELVGSVERISGEKPSAASLAVAERIGTPGRIAGLGRTVILASSEVFVDAMVAGGFSARGPHPVLLIPRHAMGLDVYYYLATADDIDHVVIMGGLAALSGFVEDELQSLGIDWTRLGGRTRFGTAQAVAKFIEGKYSTPSGERCFDRSTSALATAHVPFDSFGAGPLLAKLCAPLLLTDVQQLGTSTLKWLRDGTDSLFVFGGTAAVSQRVLAELAGEKPEDETPPEPAFDFDNPDRSTIDGIFAEAAARRAAAVADLTAHIEAEKYGVDGNYVLRGPAGFRIDLNNCVWNWSDETGVDDGEIRIGNVAPLSRTDSLYLNGLLEVSAGMENYFEWVNQNDPIIVNGRKHRIVLEQKDDRHVGLLTPIAIREFAEAGNIFSVHTLGDLTTIAGAETAGEECMPHVLNVTSHPAAGDPVNRPWTTGAQMSYSTEAILWGEWIKRNLKDRLPVRVSALISDSDWFFAYRDAFVAWAKDNPGVVSEFLEFTHPLSSEAVDEQVAAAVKASEPDVFLLMSYRTLCSDVSGAAEENGLKTDITRRGGAMFLPLHCTTDRPGWSALDDWMTIGGGTKFSTPGRRRDLPISDHDEPFAAFMEANLRAAGLSPGNDWHTQGYFIAYPYVEALRIASELPGGLTRTNFMLAVRSLDIFHPVALDGIRTRLNGNSDAFLLEGSEFYRYDDSTRSWKRLGGIINRNSKTPNCAWDKDNGFCRP